MAGTKPYKRAVLPTLTRRGRNNKSEMLLAVQAELEGLSSGDMIRALEGRGYRVFPALRVETTPAGWTITRTQEERNVPRS